MTVLPLNPGIEMSNYRKQLYFNLKGKRFYTRPIIPSDKSLLKMGFQELSPQSKYYRFFSFQKELTESQLKFFTEVDGKNHVAWGVKDISDENNHIPAAIGRYVRVKGEEEVAEVAITVVDKYHGIGLGKMLLALLNIIAGKEGISIFRYHTLPGNDAIIHIMQEIGAQKRTKESSILIIEAEVIKHPDSLAPTPVTEKFIAFLEKAESLLFPELER